jgi:hypothetical protein
MKLKLVRDTRTPTATFGKLYVDGRYYCETLEDADVLAAGGDKIPGKTAIPAGTYGVVIDWSTRYRKLMPHVLDVPGFSGVRIHAGNTVDDTDGCILVGFDRRADGIGRSRTAADGLMFRLQAEEDRGEVVILAIE